MLIFQRADLLSRSSSKWKVHFSTDGQNRSIDETKDPTNIKEVRLFLGLTGYFIKHICNYLNIVHPLNCFIKAPSSWGQGHTIPPHVQYG